MDIVEQLSRKVRLAADQLIELKQEKEELLSEMASIRDQLHHHQLLLRENDKFRQERERLRIKLAKIQKKLQKHLSLEGSVIAFSPMPGGNRESHS